MEDLSAILNRYQQLPLSEYRLFSFIVLALFTLVFPGFILGVLWGIYISINIFIYICVSDPKPEEAKVMTKQQLELIQKIKKQCSESENVDKETVYRGWMNLYNEPYDAHSFHIDLVQTVLLRLDGSMLRISKPNRSVLKHGCYNDPTLSEEEPKMVEQSIYNLTDATVCLRPRRLARRRWFSRKYPICIKLSDNQNPAISNNKRTETIGAFSDVFESDESEESDQGTSEEEYKKKHRRSTVSDPEQHQQKNNEVFTSDSNEDEPLFVPPRSASDGHLPFAGSQPLISLKSSNLSKKTQSVQTLYLFARCAREKERWFHQLRQASLKYSTSKRIHNSIPKQRFSLITSDLPSDIVVSDYFYYLLHSLQFSKYLHKHFGIDITPIDEQKPEVVFMDLGRTHWEQSEGSSGKELITAVNMIVNRVFYDFCRDEFWCDKVKNKIQNKLATIHLPYFIEALELSNFNLGTAVPVIEKLYEPIVNEWGTWLDFDVNYDGMIKLTLETSVNLIRIKERHESVVSPKKEVVPKRSLYTRPLNRYSNEEAPESPETSPDEEYGSKIKYSKGKVRKKTGGRKVLKFIDKIASTNIFKEAAELKPLKKIMNDVSSTRLILDVQVTKLEGTMTVNLANPASDRLWYSFRTPPKMSIHVVPRVGTRTIAFSTVSEWIEKKLCTVLEKNLVVPNMDDISIPIYGSELLQNLAN